MTLKATLTAAFPEARRISSFLERDYGEGGVIVSLDERADGLWAVDAYFESGGAEEIASTIRDRLGTDAFGALQSVETLPETDWITAGLAVLKPVAAGRFLIHGSHDRAAARPGRMAIEIDAGQAFGTGHHATTLGCLVVLDQLVRTRRFRNPLDIGTGSGVLAIALAKALRCPVLATDIDPHAVAIAARNARLNHVSSAVRSIVADGLAHADVRRRAPFDLIVANILAAPLMRLAPAMASVLAPGGDLVLSGLLRHQRSRVVAAYAAQKIPLRSEHRFGEWSVLHFRRPSRTTSRRKPSKPPGRAGVRAWLMDL